jgi:hypothetical protein
MPRGNIDTHVDYSSHLFPRDYIATASNRMGANARWVFAGCSTLVVQLIVQLDLGAQPEVQTSPK